ncbi:MAG: sigma-70 family RNA polymerase sigma factor, partial [bacterium]|nr:sigma-70 family RNA polymerase sigma factor [bacterium]
MPKHTIESLFIRFRDHQDLGALTEVHDRTAPQLLALARRLAVSGVPPEDLLQDTFLAAIERPDAWDSSRPLVPWLLGILAHRAHTARIKAGRTPNPDRLPERTVATPDALTQASEFQAHVSGAIAGLPPLLRDAVHGSLVDGKRPSQMAV